MEPHLYLKSVFDNIRFFLKRNSIKENDIPYLTSYLNSISIESCLILERKIDKLYRVTINKRVLGENKRIDNISFLTYPPKNYIRKFGRLNYPEQQILYATFSYLVALSEMRPDVGDIITVSTWKLKDEYHLNTGSIFYNTTKTGESHNYDSITASMYYRNKVQELPIATQLQLNVFLQFVADCFSKDVDDQNHYDYFLSAYYANRLMYKFENGEIDALIYPSVRQSLTLSNIAIKPSIFDEHYTICNVEESVVEQNVNQFSRGWSLHGSGDSKSFKEDGSIIWNTYPIIKAF